MNTRTKIESLLWWTGCTILLLILGLLFAGNMFVNGAAAVELTTQSDPAAWTFEFLMGLFSFLLTSLWAWLAFRLGKEMAAKAGVKLVFSPVNRKAAIVTAVLPLLCLLVHNVVQTRDVQQREKQQQQEARDADERVRSLWTQRESQKDRDEKAARKQQVSQAAQQATVQFESRRGRAAGSMNAPLRLFSDRDSHDPSRRGARFTAYRHVLNSLDTLDPRFTPEIQKTALAPPSWGVWKLGGAIVYKTNQRESPPLIANWYTELH